MNSEPNLNQNTNPTETNPVEPIVAKADESLPVENQDVEVLQNENVVSPIDNKPVEVMDEKPVDRSNLFVNASYEETHPNATVEEVPKPIEERPENIGIVSYSETKPKEVPTAYKKDDSPKEVEVVYSPPSKGRTILLIVFFILLIAFVLFLPDITQMIEDRKQGVYDYQEEVITSGKLKCSMETNTTNLDKSYDLVFDFTDSKLDSAHFSYYTRGDVSLDEDVLNSMNDICNKKEDAAKVLAGVTIRCTYTPGKLIEEEIFDFSSIDSKKFDEAFSGIDSADLEYEYQQNIDGIEKNLLANGYQCDREK